MNGMNARGKNLYESSYMRWDRVPTHIPHVFIEHIKLNGRSVLILNAELGVSTWTLTATLPATGSSKRSSPL